MTQYSERVRKISEKMAAEEWGKRVKYIHASNGIIETAFNNGDVQYVENKPGGKTTWKRNKTPKKTLIDNWGRAMTDLRQSILGSD